ncbi:Putative glycerol kinase 5 [Habropoda laboriosa]|uniref:Glycerol kinase 5 n=1 Tax=Habropoda laboriosa TaxID=597456 RepID=A0A0L7QKF3_9HYME|nr:PREDICTED: putative glycerol kinase 5 isoform X1 [Habropoda laboriosa]KOC59001.1 Putative glycerol kinase 5 [Habropoda laboriosa]
MRYVGALDVGTTTVRFHVLDEQANTVVSAVEKVRLLYPKSGYVEIDPDELWSTIVNVIKNSLKEMVDAGLKLESIACLGISTQRGSFTTWNMKDGRHYHNFITWKDLRADGMVKEWNSSITMKGLQIGSRILYTLSRRKRFLAASVFKFMNTQMSLRLLWALQHVPGLQEAANTGNVVFGGVDCWLLYKLTGKHVTDASSASATGLFDPFTMCWSGLVINMLKIPCSIFPEVLDTAGNFGVTPKEIFGIEIPILCSMADQSAAMFGSGSTQSGDLKITMGTGTFVNVNTGTKAHASVTGLYPLVGWRINDELVYIVEGASNDTGGLIEWAKRIGIINDVDETSSVASAMNDSDGVYFVPAFSGLQAPINDYSAATGFIGIKPTTEKSHIVRSLLESIVYRILLLYESLCAETCFTYHTIRVDGGVSRNDFILQLLADLTGLKVERATSTEMSILGVAFLAGLQCGIWKSRKEVLHLRQVQKVFLSNEENRTLYQPIIAQWKRALQRLGQWY